MESRLLKQSSDIRQVLTLFTQGKDISKIQSEDQKVKNFLVLIDKYNKTKNPSEQRTSYETDIGTVYYELNDFEQAKKWYIKGVKENNPNSIWNLAVLMHRIQEYQESIQLLIKCFPMWNGKEEEVALCRQEVLILLEKMALPKLAANQAAEEKEKPAEKNEQQAQKDCGVTARNKAAFDACIALRNIYQQNILPLRKNEILFWETEATKAFAKLVTFYQEQALHEIMTLAMKNQVYAMYELAHYFYYRKAFNEGRSKSLFLFSLVSMLLSCSDVFEQSLLTEKSLAFLKKSTLKFMVSIGDEYKTEVTAWTLFLREIFHNHANIRTADIIGSGDNKTCHAFMLGLINNAVSLGYEGIKKPEQFKQKYLAKIASVFDITDSLFARDKEKTEWITAIRGLSTHWNEETIKHCFKDSLPKPKKPAATAKEEVKVSGARAATFSNSNARADGGKYEQLRDDEPANRI